MESQCALCGFGLPVEELSEIRDVGVVCHNCDRAYRLGWENAQKRRTRQDIYGMFLRGRT